MIVWIQSSEDVKDEHPVLGLHLLLLTGEHGADNVGFRQVMAQAAGALFAADEIPRVSQSSFQAEDAALMKPKGHKSIHVNKRQTFRCLLPLNLLVKAEAQ